jgi:adenine-specific DNA-methyltransferase
VTEINFKGKEFVYNHHLSVPFRPIEMHPQKGIGEPHLDGNLIIHGDNLHALKALLPTYAGKVDCVFIDPPYNTGNEGWSYNDNVNAPMIKEWLNDNPITIEDGLRHDKWCTMMWPRLRLLHQLLAPTGSIWITLDDHESHRAKLILDAVFGEDCFRANVVWQHSVQGKGYLNKFSVHHNHLLVYGKQDFYFEGFDRTDADNVNYSNPDKDPKGMWRAGDVRNSLYRPNLIYDLVTPSGKIIVPPDNGWRWKKETFEKKLETGEAFFTENETKVVRKIYLAEQDKRAPETIWFSRESGTSRSATATLKAIFGGESPFETAKPVELLRRIMALATDEESIVLDSFSGSGTTAHAVIEANKCDGGKRKFILVEVEDYADKLTAERVRRVIKGYDFKGTQRTEMLREKINWSNFSNSEKLLEQVSAIENLHESEYDSIKKTVKDGELIVTGETKVDKRTEGLGGEFTYCTLGEPVELDKILTGKALPDFKALGAVLYHMAANEPLDAKSAKPSKFYLGKSRETHIWLLYKPEIDWLKSEKAALTLSFAREITAADKDRRHLVFAPARFVSTKMLKEQNLPVEFAPLPFALYRIERE